MLVVSTASLPCPGSRSLVSLATTERLFRDAAIGATKPMAVSLRSFCARPTKGQAVGVKCHHYCRTVTAGGNSHRSSGGAGEPANERLPIHSSAICQ